MTHFPPLILVVNFHNNAKQKAIPIITGKIQTNKHQQFMSILCVG